MKRQRANMGQTEMFKKNMRNKDKRKERKRTLRQNKQG